MESLILTLACNLYNTSPEELTAVSGGHYNAVYQFLHEDKFAILRIGEEDCPSNQTLGMLEWVRFLSTHGAPVATPVFSINKHLMETLTHYGKRFTLTAFEKAEGILAENILPSAWNTELFQSIGRSVGKFHCISADYKPRHSSLSRPQWFDSYEIHAATEKLALTSDPTGAQLSNLLDELHHFPTSPTDFGLIHGDLHFANFLVQPDGQVTIIDFDDCVYGWFAMDVAMALFDVLVLYHAASEDESQEFARLFLTSYLAGYRQEHDLSLFWQEKIPKFLKLKELCIYADLIDHPDKDKPGTWVGNFMRGRSMRISDDVPYVDIDFDVL
jgi:Ser/Thr protein kinase RdoA (MazF antagonist)